ncbi:hypothetical protein C8J56DRAFT_1058000 [Mycena floridula]|nr:hypothetical protein C8J56DRAFT_1058000 [Mycena floridula]
MTFARFIVINVWSFVRWLTEIAASVLVARPMRNIPSMNRCFSFAPPNSSSHAIARPPSHSILHPCHSTMTFSLFTMTGANSPIVSCSSTNCSSASPGDQADEADDKE